MGLEMKKFLLLLIATMFVINLFGEENFKYFFFGDKNILIDKLGTGFFYNDVLYIQGIGSVSDASGEIVPGSSFLFWASAQPDTDNLEIIWRYGVSQFYDGIFSDEIIADIDGDGNGEFCAVLNILEIMGNLPWKWLYIFKSDNLTFNQEPLIVEDFSSVFQVRPRPAQLISSDLDNDGNMELIVSFFSPNKGLAVIDSHISDTTFSMKVERVITELDQFKSILPFKTLSGILPFNVNKMSLIVIGGRQALEITVLDPTSGEVISNFEYPDVSVSDVDLENVSDGDINGDGISEIFVPVKDGGILLFYFDGEKISYKEFIPDVVKVKSLCLSDFNINGMDELIINYGEVSKLLRYEYDEIGDPYELTSYRKILYSDEMFLNFSFGQIKPVIYASGENSGNAIVSFQSPVIERSGVFLFNFEGISFGKSIEDTTLMVGKRVEISQKASTAAKKKRRREVRKPDILLHPGESMEYELEIPGFNFNNLKNLQIKIDSPSGMYFDLSTQTFYWTPADTQLGWYEVNAFFSWDNGTLEKHFTIYVNSPPEIKTFIPKADIVQKGEAFQKKIEVYDDNYDAQIFFDLIKYPEGASVDDYGNLLWKPKEDQRDWQDFVLQITDGYDTTFIDFSLFVNYPVRIVSEPQEVAFVDKLYEYSIEFIDKNRGFFYGGLDEIPKIENTDSTVVYEIPISTPEFIAKLPQYARGFRDILKNNQFQSNYQRRLVEGIQNVLVDNDRLIFLVNKKYIENYDSSKLISRFCRILNIPKPEHLRGLVRLLHRFTLKGAPEGMTIDGMGRITWIPKSFQAGTHNFSAIVSDGYFADEQPVRVYVNSKPVIVSKPDTIAFVNKQWVYMVKVRDLNKDAVLKYSLLNAPEGMSITEDGVINWIPTISQLNYNSFSVEVSDGYQSDIQHIKVYVNSPPVVLSKPDPVAIVGIKYQYKLDVEDPNGNPMTYRVIRIPKYAEFDPLTGLLTWTPRSTQRGNNFIIFEIQDNYNGITKHEFMVTVFKNPTNKALSYLTYVALIFTTFGMLYFAIYK